MLCLFLQNAGLSPPVKASFYEAVRCCLCGIHSEVNSLKEVGEMPCLFLFQLVFQESVEICSE